MGNIFAGSSPVKYSSTRQKQYFNSKKQDSNRGHVVKHEQNLQVDMSKWLREVLPPTVHFRSDTGSGAFNSEWEKQIHNSMQSSDKQPDLTIFAARRGFHGLVIELKADGVDLRMKRNGTKIRVSRKRVKPTKKNPTGWKILERDYKIRMKGDWSSLHIERQAQVLEDYKVEGYSAWFAVGEVAFKKIVCWYFEIPYLENLEMF
jgi:hypothetical protein